MSQGGSGQLTGGGHQVIRFEVDIPNLFVKRVMLGSDGELSMATFGVHPKDRDGRDLRIERVWSIVTKGQRVKVTARSGQSSSRTLFHGWIVTASVSAGGRMEDLEYTALGLDWGLRIERLFGSWCADTSGNLGSDGLALWLRAIPAVFNPDGKPNKHSADAYDDEGNGRAVFDLDAEDANEAVQIWNAKDMVRYCVAGERKGELSSSEGRIFKTDGAYGGELAEFKPFDVNAEGEDIWSALVKLANRCSHGVRVRYTQSREDTEIVFFTKKLDDAKEVKQFELPAANLDNVSLSDPMATVASLDVQHELSGIVRRVDAVAPPKLYEHEYEMLQGWKIEDEEAAFGDGGTVAEQVATFIKETDPETSSDWERFRNVGRRYILNETGRDDTTTPEVGPYDFGEAFGGDEWVVRNRPFRRQRVTLSEAGVPLPVAVHVNWSGLAQDVKLGHDVELLPDRAGIYFRGRPLILPARAIASGSTDDLFPNAVTVEAVVEGDQDSPHDVNGILSGDDMPVPTFGLIRLDDGYRQDNVTEDDSAREAAQKLCDEAVAEAKGERIVGTATCPWITFAFDVGDVVNKVNGRNLKVNAIICKVTYDAEQQCTEFALHYPEIETQTHGRAARNVRPAGVGARTDENMRLVGELLSLRAMGHPVDDALGAALSGQSRSAVQRIVNRAAAGGGTDPFELDREESP